MIAPPRWIERLLTSLGGESHCRDAILGDLAEEFAIRVEEQGVATARRWYRREALRTAPHLLASWMRHLTLPDLGRLCVAVVAAGVVHRLLAVAIPTAIVMSLGVKPDSVSIVAVAWRDVLSDTVALKWIGISLLRMLPFVAGFLAGSFNPRAPIPTAIALATIDAAVLVYAYTWSPGNMPTMARAFLVLTTLMNLGAIVLGGAFRALIDRHARAGVDQLPAM